MLLLCSSCFKKELLLDSSNSQKSIMIQHQYQQVGFDSPEILYSSDSNYVLVKNYQEKIDNNNVTLNFFIFNLESNQIIYQKKMQNSEVAWLNNDEIIIKKNISTNNDSSKVQSEYLINFKTQKKIKIN